MLPTGRGRKEWRPDLRFNFCLNRPSANKFDDRSGMSSQAAKSDVCVPHGPFLRDVSFPPRARDCHASLSEGGISVPCSVDGTSRCPLQFNSLPSITSFKANKVPASPRSSIESTSRFPKELKVRARSAAIFWFDVNQSCGQLLKASSRRIPQITPSSRTVKMISDDELYRLAIFLGSAAMVLIVVYSFLEVNTRDETVATASEKVVAGKPVQGPAVPVLSQQNTLTK